MFSATKLRPSAARSIVRGFTTVPTLAAPSMARLLLLGTVTEVGPVTTDAVGHPYVSYTVGTRNPRVQPSQAGATPEQGASWHTIFAAGEDAHEAAALQVGTVIRVEADFAVEHKTLESGEQANTTWALQNNMQIIDVPMSVQQPPVQ